MRHATGYRFVLIVMSMILALSLTSCNAQIQLLKEYGEKLFPGSSQTEEDETATEDGSADEPVDKTSDETLAENEVKTADETADEPAPVGYSKEAEESLDFLRGGLYESALAGVTYLGYREAGDTTPLADWLTESSYGQPDLFPFLLEVPPEQIIGGESGHLFCIVPRDDSINLVIDHVTWQSTQYEINAVSDAVLYEKQSAEPVLLFVHYKNEKDIGYQQPDVWVKLLVDDVADSVHWYPEIDEYDYVVGPVDEDGPVLMEFGFVTGLDYPADWEDSESWESAENWDLSEEYGYAAPTDMGLADTSWYCGGEWMMDLHGNDRTPGYSGSVELYDHIYDGIEDETWDETWDDPAYSGIWRMEGDCLRLELTDRSGNSFSGSFPVLIDLSGENLSIYQDYETLVCPPFFEEGITSMNLIPSYYYYSE